MDIAPEQVKETIAKHQGSEKKGMRVNMTKVDKKEVERLYKMVKSSFKKTPPKLNEEKGEYDAFNTVLSITNFDHCTNDLESLRTFYEAFYPTIVGMYLEIEALSREIRQQKVDFLPVIQALTFNKLWKEGQYEENFKKASEIIKKEGSKEEYKLR